MERLYKDGVGIREAGGSSFRNSEWKRKVLVRGGDFGLTTRKIDREVVESFVQGWKLEQVRV